jgi:tyrosyl-tRNA synthetase
MIKPSSQFLTRLYERDYVHQCTDLEGLDRAAAAGRMVAYIGFDCTAPSLHIGHLLPIMMLRRFQQCGHKPIVLIGGGTTKVGDPSGKDESRKLLSNEEIAANIAAIGKTFARFLTFGDGESDALMVNNAEWLDRLSYIPFLRDVGPHFTINRMLTFDSVRLRLEREQPLTFLEFNYMLLQAYDFLELHRRFACRLQMGGQDQWGNIVNGIELVRRLSNESVYGLTCPLITTASGTKMGKTAKGAVWLAADFLSPWDYWQFWRNVEDADVGRFMRLFTDLPLAEIARYEQLRGQEINEAKKRLASETTMLLHGQAAARQAAETARDTFEKGEASEGLPSLAIAAGELAQGIPLFEVMRRAGLAESGSAARRLIKGGGARVNDEKIIDDGALLSSANLNPEGHIKISAGRKKYVLVRPQ